MDYKKKLENAFLPHIKYGIMKNDNKKYLDMGYRWIIVAVFPYLCRGTNPLFSGYCSIPDYHTVVKEEFERLLSPIFSDYKIMVDISPFKEKIMASELGLGEIGENNLLLTKEYGSYVFIGEALIKEDLEVLKYEKPSVCLHCGKCRKKCPNGALEDGFEKEKCLSYLTQKKKLNEEEINLLKKASVIFGCDICQLACPVNEKAKETMVEGFKKEKVDLTKEKILSLSEENFQKEYGNFAFAYKGVEILKRNVGIIYED